MRRGAKRAALHPRQRPLAGPPATAEEASLLETPAGSPVIHLIHNAADENGDTLEVSESVWPADRIVVIDDYGIAQEPEDQEGMSDV